MRSIEHYYRNKINISYPDLPIVKKRDDILEAIENNQIIIVCGETGSGKTTQLPKICYEYLLNKFQNDPDSRPGVIGCTQPRRLAATSVAERTVEETSTSLGDFIGYQIRFEEYFSDLTAIKFMTDGVLLAEVHDDPSWLRYSVLIIDEAHERSLNIDFILGYLKNLSNIRKDLKIIISSATLDFGHFADFFHNAPIIHVEGKVFPVEIHYLEEADKSLDLYEKILEALEWTDDINPNGDTLIFLPGEREILEIMDFLTGNSLRNYPKWELLPLYSRLDKNEQARVFHKYKNRRKIILSTNVAETSLTIAGIIFVIDSGLVKVNRYHPLQSIQRLQVEMITQANAKQRSGRCGRTANGVCVRLYTSEEHDKRPDFIEPEMRRSSLADIILKMKILDLPEIEDFPFMNPPSLQHIKEGKQALREILALDDKNKVTDLGISISRLPIDVRLSKMLFASRHLNCIKETMIIVTFLSVGDARERPSDNPYIADKIHAKWSHPRSDFLSILRIWRDISHFFSKKNYHEALNNFCKKNYLNYLRVVDWNNLQKQLTEILEKEFRFKWNKDIKISNEVNHKLYRKIHTSILAGIPTQFGFFDYKTKLFNGVNGKKFSIFPGSGLFRKKAEYRSLLAFDLVETNRLYARKAAVILPEWIEDIVSHLCKKQYSEPKWNRSKGFVEALESITIYGFTIKNNIKVNYGKINSKESREIFIRKALIPNIEEFRDEPIHPSKWNIDDNNAFYHGLKKLPKLIVDNSKTIMNVILNEIKLRKVHEYFDNESLFDFYNKYLPTDIYTEASFLSFLKNDKNNTELLINNDNIIYRKFPDSLEVLFPDWVSNNGIDIAIHYTYNPGEKYDGICFECNLKNVYSIDEWFGDWLVPGMIYEKTYYILNELRTNNILNGFSKIGLKEVADNFIKEVEPVKKYSIALSNYLSISLKKEIFEDQILDINLPNFLQAKFWVYDDDKFDKVFFEPFENVKKLLSQKIQKLLFNKFKKKFNKRGQKYWNFDDLPLEIKDYGTTFYPRLYDEGISKKSVGIRLYDNKVQAKKNHLSGLAKLFIIKEQKFVDFFENNLAKDHFDLLKINEYFNESIKNFNHAVFFISVEKSFLDLDTLPLKKDDFNKSLPVIRESLDRNYDKIIHIISEILNSLSKMTEFINENEIDDTVTSDIKLQIEFLLRKDFMYRSGVEKILRYDKYFKGILYRFDKYKNKPIKIEIDKSSSVKKHAIRWLAAGSDIIGNWELEQFGWFLEEYRLHLFANELLERGDFSIKKFELLARELKLK